MRRSGKSRSSRSLRRTSTMVGGQQQSGSSSLGIVRKVAGMEVTSGEIGDLIAPQHQVFGEPVPGGLWKPRGSSCKPRFWISIGRW